MTTRSLLLLGCWTALASCVAPLTDPDIRESEIAAGGGATSLGSDIWLPSSLRTIAVQSPTMPGSRAATGARASGHADIVEEISPTLTIGSKYSFTAIATLPSLDAPFAAKGQLEGTIVRTTGLTSVVETVHAEVDCMNFLSRAGFPDMVAISGRVKKLTRDGRRVPVTSGMQVVFTVRDEGEGSDSPPDLASFIAPIIEGRPLCQIFFVLMVPNPRGNIQVRWPEGASGGE